MTRASRARTIARDVGTVQKTGRNTWRVESAAKMKKSTAKKHYNIIDWGVADPNGRFTCECIDYRNGNKCKHIRAVELVIARDELGIDLIGE